MTKISDPQQCYQQSDDNHGALKEILSTNATANDAIRCRHLFRKEGAVLAVRSLAMLSVLALFSTACGLFSPDDASTVRIEGRVYARCVHPNPAVAGPCVNTEPIGGAIVSTSLDSVTTTTDGSGAFDLKTNAPESKGGCNVYTLTVTAAGHPTYSMAAAWGTHPVNQDIVLSPPSPSVFTSCS